MTTQKDLLGIIKTWFDQTGGGGLILPDGWFGRPYDNKHILTYLEARPHKVLLELDDLLLLIFTELRTARIEGSLLILTDFVQCVFDWQEYGSLEPHTTVYQEGTVKFIP
ncbi:hypothetical protein [Kallotenue papyrolyticum]|uniref:hypothetical protein n=1 Tax=Kallotenue papyrolyticum TaxID=1325125 RepID=UPI001269622A|nr:hypothetical protein [Kallotenue papyrolyticum]